MNRRAWILTPGLALLAWQAPMPLSEAGKAIDLPKVIVIKGKTDVKEILSKEKLPKEIAKSTNPQGLSAEQKMQVLKGGHGVLPLLTTGNTVNLLRLTPRVPYKTEFQRIEFYSCPFSQIQTNQLVIGPEPDGRLDLYFEVQRGKRYLIEFSVLGDGEFDVNGPEGGRSKVTLPKSTTSIPILYDVPQSAKGAPYNRRRIELKSTKGFWFRWCEVTTLN